MSRKSLPVVGITMILVIALATMGLAYGLWSETLTISGTVNTGTLDVEFSLGEVVEKEEKDVGQCSAELSEDKNTLSVTVSNGYPSYKCSVTFDVHNAGTIPVLVHQPKFTYPSGLSVGFEDCYDDDTQLDSSGQAWCTLWVHVEQGAGQESTYTFSGSILAHQYNEEP